MYKGRKTHSKNENERKLINILVITLIIIIYLLYTFLFINIHTPFYQKGFDSYANLGTIKYLESQVNHDITYEPDLFPGNYKGDFHIGLNTILMIILIKILDISYVNLFLILGLINIILFIISLKIFLNSMNIKDNIQLNFFILFLLLSTSIPVLYGSSMSISDILVTAHYSSFFAFSIFLLLLSININQKFNKNVTYMLNLILFFLLFSSHLLTGFIYLGLYFIFLFSILIQNKKIESFRIYTILIYLFAMLLLLSWPYNNWLKFFISSEPLQNSILSYNQFDLNVILGYISIISLGIVGLWKSTRKIFLYLWSILFFLICISLLFPIRISSYWRFLPFLKIPLTLGLSFLFISILKNNKLKIVIFSITIIILILANIYNINNTILTKENDYDKTLQLMNFIPQKSKILSDPFISYDLQGIGNYQVLFIASGHITDPEINKQNDDYINRWYDGCNFTDQEFKIFDYVIIPKNNQACMTQITNKNFQIKNETKDYNIYEKIS